MEIPCELCLKVADVTCSCDSSLRFCYKDFFKVHKITKGTHEPVELEKQRINENFISVIENLSKLKSRVISKSNELIKIIQLIATKKISLIKKILDSCEKVLLNDEKLGKEYENLQIQESDLTSFLKIMNKSFSFFKNDNEITDGDLEILLNESKLKSSKSLKNVEETKEPIESSFDTFLEGHTS